MEKVDEYVQEVTDRIDDWYNSTNEFLDKASNAWNRLQRLKDKYFDLETRATCAGGLNYERMGMYGCKIQTSHTYGIEDVLVELAEVEEEYEEAFRAYEVARMELIDVVESAGLTDVQQRVMYLRHADGSHMNYYEIARKAGLRNYDSAWYQYKKAYVKIANYLRGAA